MSLLSASMDKTLIVWAPDKESGVWLEKVKYVLAPSVPCSRSLSQFLSHEATRNITPPPPPPPRQSDDVSPSQVLVPLPPVSRENFSESELLCPRTQHRDLARTRTHRAYLHYKKRKKKTTTITTEWNEVMKEKQKMKKSCSLLRASAGSWST